MTLRTALAITRRNIDLGIQGPDDFEKLFIANASTETRRVPGKDARRMASRRKSP